MKKKILLFFISLLLLTSCGFNNKDDKDLMIGDNATLVEVNDNTSSRDFKLIDFKVLSQNKKYYFVIETSSLPDMDCSLIDDDNHDVICIFNKTTGHDIYSFSIDKAMLEETSSLTIEFSNEKSGYANIPLNIETINKVGLISVDNIELEKKDETVSGETNGYFVNKDASKTPFEVLEIEKENNGETFSIYLTIESIPQMDVCVFNPPNGDLLKLFLNPTTGKDEYTFDIEKSLIQKCNEIVVSFWKGDDCVDIVLHPAFFD